MNKLFSGAIGVQIPLDINNRKYTLPFLPQLRGKRVKHIEFCRADDLSITPQGIDISTTFENVYLTLYDANSNKEVVSSLPVNILNSNGSRLFLNMVIDMERSFISIKDSNPDLAGKAFYLVFFYDEPFAWGQIPAQNRTLISSLELYISDKKTFFDENPILSNRKFQNLILSFPVISPKGRPGYESNDINDKFLTLKKNSLEFFKDVPLYLFYQANLYHPLRLQNISFDIQSSYIISKVTTGLTLFFNCIIDDN